MLRSMHLVIVRRSQYSDTVTIYMCFNGINRMEYMKLWFYAAIQEIAVPSQCRYFAFAG